MPMHRAVPIQTPVESGRKFPWRRHIGVALHAVGNMVGVFLMHTGESEGREAIGRYVRRRIRRRDRRKTEQQGDKKQDWFHLLGSCRTQTTQMCHITLRCPITNYNGENPVDTTARTIGEKPRRLASHKPWRATHRESGGSVAGESPEWHSGQRANQLLEGRIESLTANKKLAITIPASMIAMLSIIAFRCIPIPGMTSSEFATTGIATAATV